MFSAINGTRIGSIKTLIVPGPAAQNMTYVITWSRIAKKLTNIEFLNLSQYVPRNAYVHFPEFLGTGYGTDTEQIRTYSWKLLKVLLDQIQCLTTSFQWILVIATVNFYYRFLKKFLVDWLIFHSFSLRLQFDDIVCN